MTIPRMARAFAQFRQQVIRSADKLNEFTHGWLGILVGAARETLKPESAITTAAIAYFALFSLFPITLLSISIASFYLGPLMDQQLIVQKLEFRSESAITTAAIAYFALFSLFPITLLSISIASFYLGPLMDQQLIVQKLEF